MSAFREHLAARRDAMRNRLLGFAGKPTVVVAGVFLGLMLVAAVVVSPHLAGAAQRGDLSLRFASPFSLSHGLSYVLGADALGRSVLVQLVYGAQASFLVAGLAVAMAAVAGSVIGLLGGYFGGFADAAVMRVTDVLQTVPKLLLAIAVMAVLGPSLVNLVLVLAFARLPVFIRTVRAQALSIRERTYVEAARAIGARDGRILRRDVWPMVMPSVVTVAMLEIAQVMLTAAALSFLGLGLQRPELDWGMMVSEGRAYLTSAWWVSFFPGILIMATALAATIMSNWWRASMDPRVAGRAAAGASLVARENSR